MTDPRWRRAAALENDRRAAAAPLFAWAGLVPTVTPEDQRAKVEAAIASQRAPVPLPRHPDEAQNLRAEVLALLPLEAQYALGARLAELPLSTDGDASFWRAALEDRALSIPFPLGIDQANAAWGANCGPFAVAAVLGLYRPASLATVRPAFPHFPERAHTNLSDAIRALQHLGLAATPIDLTASRPTDFVGLPHRGVARILFTGPWSASGVHPQAALTRSHLVAFTGHGALVADANAPSWLPPRLWARDILPDLIASYPRADGGWFIRDCVATHTKGTP